MKPEKEEDAPRLPIAVRALWLPKAGNSVEEYEDAFWPAESVEGSERRTLRCAIGDGATETSFSGLWAQLLVREYCRQSTALRFLRTLPDLRRKWQEHVRARPLPWYAEQKAQSGAFSSLLGLTLRAGGESDAPAWECLAVGDSCLFQMRGQEMVTAFPIQASADFGNHPYLISSLAQSREELSRHLLFTDGTCRAGDVFTLMTDALACWFLQRMEENAGAVDALAEIESAGDFAAFVERERRERDENGRPRLRNDDVTLLKVEIL